MIVYLIISVVVALTSYFKIFTIVYIRSTHWFLELIEKKSNVTGG